MSTESSPKLISIRVFSSKYDKINMYYSFTLFNYKRKIRSVHEDTDVFYKLYYGKILFCCLIKL